MIAAIDLGVVITYLILILAAGLYFSRNMKSSLDYFLASKSIPWYWIMCGLWAANIGFVHGFMAHGGSAYNWGLVQANWEWAQGPFQYIMAGILFVPFYWKVGIFTISEFIEKRFNAWCRVIYTVIWIIFFIVTAGAELYLASKFLGYAVGIDLWAAVAILVGIVGAYTFFGGLAAIVISDVIQFFIMMIATIPIFFLLSDKFGGMINAMNTMIDKWSVSSAYFNLEPGLGHPYAPGLWIILGLCFVIAMTWSVLNQSMIQRSLGAKSVYDAKMGGVMVGIPKTVGAFLYMVPMVMAPLFFASEGIFVVSPDTAYMQLLLHILPVGMLGFGIAGLFAAGMSTLDAMYNSIATMFTRDIYERFFVRDKPDSHYFKAGKVATAIAIAISVFMVVLVMNVPLIMTMELTILSIFSGPFFAISVMGVFWKKANGKGALAGIIIGCLCTLTLLMLDTMFLKNAVAGFIVTAIVTYAVSKRSKEKPDESIGDITWGSGSEEEQDYIKWRAEHADQIGGAGIKSKLPFYKDLRIWVTAILLVQVLLLLFFAGV